jgi:hypothetical protein
MMNEDKSKGAVIEGTGVYTSIMVLSVLCTEVIVGAKLNLLGEGLGYYVVNEVGYLVFPVAGSKPPAGCTGCVTGWVTGCTGAPEGCVTCCPVAGSKAP